MSDTQQVWDDFSTTLRGFIQRRVEDDHVADDLLQDVFIRIHNKLDSVADEDRLVAWMYRIARNVVTDRYRHHPLRHSTQVKPKRIKTPEKRTSMNRSAIGWVIS